MIRLLYIVFALSGAAGLMYESIWTRYLGLFVGHSAYAQIIVLVIFLGGMALGALLIGRRSERIREPLLWYATTEAATGIIALFFHGLFGVVTRVAYDSVLPTLPPGFATIAVRWTIAALLILPQSVLLGATFPLMSAGIMRRLRETPGRVLSLLYFGNSLGAAIGALVAGFYLVETVGLPGTLIAAGSINMLVGLAVWGALRLNPSEILPAPIPSLETDLAPPLAVRVRIRRDPLLRLMLWVAFGTAVASFIYEIAWIRMLSLVLGSATHSFELMLSAFVLGLALGALWVRSRADRIIDPLQMLGTVQWIMGALAVATLPLYLASFAWTVSLFRTLGFTTEAYHAFTVVRYAICLIVMLPATFCAGITLPLITRTLLTSETGERAVGLVYGSNTLGSIVGAGLAGLVLLPALGLKLLLITGALVDMTLGVVLLARQSGRMLLASRATAIAAAATLLAVAGIAAGASFDMSMITAGVFRSRALPRAGQLEVVSHHDGRTASVTVHRSPLTRQLSIATNGKPDASISADWFPGDSSRHGRRAIIGDESTQLLLPLLAMAYRPAPQHVAVIGEGSGMTSHFVLGDPQVGEVATIEIEPEMIRGSRSFYPVNRRVFDDPRAHFVIDDARAYLSTSRQRYDLILSEPSNPWVSGVAGLFTDEFYERIERYLADDGIFGQWLHLYELDDDLVLSVIAALHDHFPAYRIYQVSDYDVLIVAGKRATLPEPDWSVVNMPGIASDLEHLLPLTGAGLAATWIADRTVMTFLRPGVPANSDYFPILDLGAEETRFKRVAADGFATLANERFDVAAAIAGQRIPFGTQAVATVPSIPRLKALALGASLRYDIRAHPDSAPAEDVGNAQYRLVSFAAELRTGAPPTNWLVWTREFLAVERDLHGGTAGVVADAFYDAVYAYLRAARAPAAATESVDFLHGLAAWDFAQAARAGDLLREDLLRHGREWVSPDLLRDGLVIAKVRTGDITGARAAANRLASYAGRDAASLRTRLVDSYLAAAEHGAP